MQSHHPFGSTGEDEISFFEEAFDSDSLKKFFQEQELCISTPSTALVNTRSFSEPQSSAYSSTSIFGSPISIYHKQAFEKRPDNTGLNPIQATLFKSEDLFGTDSHEIKQWGGDEEIEKMGRLQRIASAGYKSEDSRMEIVKGSNRITINVGGKGNSEQMLGMGEEGKADYNEKAVKKASFAKSDEGEEEIVRSFERKLVFTIEKSVRSKVIEKKEKMKNNVPVLLKKESEEGEVKVKRKNSSKSHGEGKMKRKDSVNGMKLERKVSKDETENEWKVRKEKNKQKDENSHTS